MSAGDFLIYRNNALTTTLPNAGTNIDAAWDTEVIDEGSAATYSSGTFTFTNTAPYLIIYSERFSTVDVTNNERIEGQGRLRVNGVNLVAGASEGYIRKSSGDQEMILSGVTIYNATASDTLVTRFYRGDNSSSGIVTRDPDFGGVQIFELDAADDYARYATTATNSITSTESSITNWTNNQQETGFSRSSGAVTISTAGRYLMTFSGTTSQGGTSRIGGTVFMERGTTPITGVRGYSHMRGSDGNQNGALSFAAIVDVSASDSFTMRTDADSGTVTLDSGAVWQWWQLPSGNETAIMEATNGNMNPTAPTAFAWDTLPHIDTGGFTATAGNANIDVDQGCHLLAFWNQGKTIIDSLQRAAPMGQIAVDGAIINHSASSSYHRNSGSIGTFMVHSGAALIPTVPSGSEITLVNTALGAIGNLDVESGHFSLINLEGLYTNYTYAFPVIISDVDTDDVINNTQTNVVITGTEFEAVQGTGLVELVENDDYTGTKITQSIDSWADTSIQFDVTAGALANTYCFLFVTNDTGTKGYIQIQVGIPPETYQEAVEGMTLVPDHYWRFQNSYSDEIGTATANNSSGGTPTFATTPKLVKGDTHSLLLNSTTDYVSPADQSDMNVTITANRRYVGGWIQLDSVSQTLSVIWEEGAQVNNFALLNGFGNNPIFQFADASGDYVQAYFDVSLTPDRPYFILAEFNSSAQKSGVCGVHLDGVLQSRTNGNPWEPATFPTHSGNISWGHEGTEDLKVGDDRGVDATVIEFTSPVSCNYSHWFSWSNVSLDNTTDIRETLFEKGALAEQVIGADTEANMQIDIDTHSATLFADWPCSIEIDICDDGDFELIMDDITFEDRVSMQIRYLGVDTLTLVTKNGTALDVDKLGAPYGGTIIVVNAVDTKVTTKDSADLSTITSAFRVLVLAATGGDLPFEDVVTITRASTTATVTHTAHGLRTGMSVLIQNADQQEYKGIKSITVTDANTYTYTVSGSPTTPATGTILCTSVIINGNTSSGEILTQDHRYTSDQPIKITARRSTSSPIYKSATSSATILSTGLDANIFMISDE